MRYRLTINVIEEDDEGIETVLFALGNEQEYLTPVIQVMYGGVKLFASNQYIEPTGDGAETNPDDTLLDGV